jgi:hypothetical protein
MLGTTVVLWMVINVFEESAASSSRPEKVTFSKPLGPVVLLTTTALTLPYVTDFHARLTFILKQDEAVGSFPLITLATIYLYHITSQKIAVLKNGF